MPYSVTIDQQFSADIDQALNCQLQTVRLTITVTSVIGLPDTGVLVFSIDPQTSVERYSHVANACDLQTYDLDVLTDKEYVRRSTVSLYFPNAQQAQQTALEFGLSIQQLVDDLEAADQLGPAQTLTFTGVA